MRDDLFATGVHDGYLAYAERAPVGWVQAGPRDDLPKIAETFSLAPDPDAWAIGCFMVLAPYRGRASGGGSSIAVLDDIRSRGVERRRGLPPPRHRPRGRGRVDGARVAVPRGRLHRGEPRPASGGLPPRPRHLTRRATPAVSLAPFPAIERCQAHRHPRSRSSGPRSSRDPRSSAPNIASVPWRCGQSWNVPGSGPAHQGTPGSSATASPSVASSRAARTADDDLGRLGQHRRAGRVEHHPAWPHGVERRREQRLLQRHERVEVRGLPAPARLGSAPERTEAGAGCVDQHPVERPRRPRRADAVGRHHAEHAVGVAERTSYQSGAVGLELAGEHAGTALRRPAPPAARPCRPARRRGRASARPGPSIGADGQREGDQLGALVLHPRPALGDRGDGARVARRPAARRTASRASARQAARRGSSDRAARPE